MLRDLVDLGMIKPVLPMVHPYTVSTPVCRASVLPSTKLCKASLRLLCRGVRVELLLGTEREVKEGEASTEPGNSNWRVAAMWRSFR